MNWQDKIKESLGKPYYEKCSVLLYNVNCIEALKKLPRNCIDLILTSPPYNIGKEYEKILPIEDNVDVSNDYDTLLEIAETNKIGTSYSGNPLFD